MAAITQDRLRQLLAYDPATGSFTWLIAHGRNNRIPAGTSAGTEATDGAVVIRFDGKSHRAHRLAWLYVHGELPAEVDHENNKPSDNRIGNLRPCTHKQNTRNVRMHRDTASGLKGAYRDKKRWTSRIMVDGRDIYLGTFDTAQQAAAAYDQAARQYHGEFAKTNGAI